MQFKKRVSLCKLTVLHPADPRALELMEFINNNNIYTFPVQGVRVYLDILISFKCRVTPVFVYPPFPSVGRLIGTLMLPASLLLAAFCGSESPCVECF